MAAYPLANLTKKGIRKTVSFRVDDWWPEELSSIGNAGGTTAVFSSLVGYPRSSFINKYLLITEETAGGGVSIGTWRIISDFDPANGTITVARAFVEQIASGTDVEIHSFRPDLYTLAINEAITKLRDNIWRDVQHHAFVRTSAQRTFPLPRNMQQVQRLSIDNRQSERQQDFFDRANSTTAPGSLWTSSVGDWGITSESLYAPGDTDADRILAVTNPQVKNGVIQAVVRGDTTDTASRVLSILFRYEDASFPPLPSPFGLVPTVILTAAQLGVEE